MLLSVAGGGVVTEVPPPHPENTANIVTALIRRPLNRKPLNRNLRICMDDLSILNFPTLSRSKAPAKPNHP
jgi:hypothetical protein